MQHITHSRVCGDAVAHKPTALSVVARIAHAVTVVGCAVYACASALCDVRMTESPSYSFLTVGPHCKLYMSVNPHVRKSKVIFPKKERIQFILRFLGLGTKDI